MDELTRNIQSASWWFGVVAVGLVLNLMSAYLKAPIDFVLSALSARWRTYSSNARAARDLRVTHLRADEHAQTLLIADEMREHFRSILFMLFALFFLVFYIVVRVRVPSAEVLSSDFHVLVLLRVLYWASLVATFMSMASFFRAKECRSVLREASRDAHPG